MNLCFMYNVNVQLLFLLLILLVGLPVKVRPEADGGGRTRFQNGNEGVTRDKHTPTRDCSNAQIPENVLPGLQVVFPVMSRSERDLPLSTFNKDTQAYKRHVVVRFTYNGVKHKLKLQHNSKLMAKKRAGDYIQGRDCYYQGFCSRSEHMGKESLVSLSTCDGLRGVIEIDGVAHRIYPHEQSTKDMECRPHIIYKMTSAKDSLCGNQSGQWSSFEKLHSDQVQSIVEQKYRGDPLVSGERRSTDPRYLELALIVDNSLFGKFGFSEDKAMEFVLQITNIIDMYYQRLNIRVGLIYHEFWTEDNIKISSNPRETLLNFVKYAETNLDSTHYDLAHLLSGQLFDGHSSGLAVPDSVCLKRGVAVISSQSEENSRHLASVISHMIGHNIGLLHDTKVYNFPYDDCQCEDLESGCIMDMNLGSKSPTQFSSCSVSRLQMLTRVGLGSCLLDEPQENPFPQSCGNGFVERGEQCDCGTAENCEREDPCCEPTTCLLKPNARCRSGPCCHNCLPKASTQVCRSADGDCDAAEYCDGVTGECPADSTIADGQSCPGGICYNGRCPTREAQCKQFWDTEAAAAHDECYTYNNPQGNLFGHCGLDKEGQPIKCSQQDSFCGLLQCAGGTRYTIQSNLEYRTTSVGSNANTKYQCKVVIANLEDDLAAVGMVLDGSTCGDGKVCLNSKCVSTAESFALAQCPKGENNLTCSGNGRCTTVKTCSCNHGYDGILCDQILPTSYSKDVGADLTNPEAERRTLDTKWLIVIICVVTVVVISAAVIAFLCCRRQVVSPARKRPNKRKQSHLNESLDLERDRAISFGQTPSYRNEKDGKRKRRRKRKPSSSGEDETDSDERAAGADRIDIVIPEELSRQPERGILKKSTSSAFEGIEDDECHSQCSCTDTGSCSCSDHDNEPAPIDRHIHTSTNQDPEQEIPPPREFDTNMYSKRFETNAQVEVNHCEEVSPTDSEHMQYCAPEVDQYYKTFTPPYNKYNPVLPPQSQQGADSATDSAIDMPGDGSVSTINDIAPLHHKHKPTIIDYLDIQSQSDDSRSPRVYRPPPPPYIKRNTPTLTGQGQISSPPTIQEYSKPPINRSLESNRHATESSFHSFTPHSDRGSDYTTRLDETRVDDSVVV